MKKILMAILMLNLVGCAFGSGTNDQERDEIERKEELQKNYSQIVGTYEGTLTVSGRTTDMKLYVYTVDVESGKNQLGEPQLIPVLYAKFRRMDGIQADRVLKARYMSASGEFSAVTGQSQNGSSGNDTPKSDPNSFNLRGHLNGRILEGEIVKTTGFYGSFSLVRSTGPQSGPNDGDEQEYREHVRRELRKITGVYTGTVSNPGGTPFPVQIDLRAVEKYAGETWSISLTAIYTRTDIDPSLTRRMMAASYDPTSTPPSIDLLSEGTYPGSSIPNSNYLNIVGSIGDGKITAEIADHRGPLGILNATR